MSAAPRNRRSVGLGFHVTVNRKNSVCMAENMRAEQGEIMKRIMRAVAVAVLVLGITFTDSAIAFAETTATAGSLDEVTQIVSQAGVNREDKVVINYTGDPSDLDPIKDSINNYNPFIFLYGWLLQKDDPTTSNDADYLVGNLEYSNANYNITFDMKKRELIFNLEYFETLEQTEYVNTHVPEILNSIGMEGKSNYEKVKGIHDYVCDLITYDNESENCNSMYGAIVDRLALCNAYSLCMYKLCVEAGIPCKYIGG